MAVPPEAPLADDEFEAAMRRLEPFESAPFLAVAVSGGADSMALALLCDGWARRRGGSIVALTVDHRLRIESAAEAAQTATWLAAHGVAHETLVREGAPPIRGVQEAARAARYALLDGWCGAHGCLHLLLAHHLEDQAETFLLRLSRGSGVDGLAAMAVVSELPHCRALRPLLGIPHARLVATLSAKGQKFLADPSNADPRYARVRLRRSASALATEGLTPQRLAGTARRLGRARGVLEAAVDRLLASTATLDPAGYARLDFSGLADATDELALRVLARLVAAAGGSAHPPRLERLERLLAALRGGLDRAATLGGCRILPRQGTILICREPASVAGPIELVPGCASRWDGRFTARPAVDAPRGLRLAALGATWPRDLVASLPPPVRPSLPALYDDQGLCAIPHVGWSRDGMEPLPVAFDYRPARALSRAGFTVV